MNAMSLALQWLLGVAFATLGAATTIAWLRQRDPGRRYLTLSIAMLGVVGLLSSLEVTLDDPYGVITDATLVVFTLSGWAFLRFRDDLVPLRPRIRFAADAAVAITVVVLLAAYAPAGGATRTGVPQDAAALLLLVVWGTCVVEPLVRFWRLSARMAQVQRARARALVAAYGGIVVVLVLSVVLGVAGSSNQGYYRVAYAIGVLVVPLFYIAFAPPLWLRRMWREREEEPFRAALTKLLLYSPDRQTLAERAVSWAARLVGADAAVVASDDGSVLATHGLDQAAAWEIVRDLAGGAKRSSGQGSLISVPLRSEYATGLVAVVAGPLTPIFSGDEVARLQEYAAALTTALDRVLLVEQMRRSAQLIDLAYNPIFTWDLATGVITYWNRAAENTYGHSTDEAVGRRADDLLQTKLPAPREEVLGELRERRRWTGEIVQVTKSGRQLVVSARWALQSGPSGPDVVLEINRDVTQERRMTEELREARDVAERASAAKSEYLSRMSHELRTPLTAILGYSDLLEMRDPRDDQLEAISSIQQASSHLLSLVNDVLDIARIESGRDNLSTEPVAVSATIAECVRLVSPAAAERGTRIERRISDYGHSHVLADRQRLVQALLNLLSNAVKYAGAGAHVRISAGGDSSGKVRIAVADDGPGLSEEQQARLFQPFERLGAERSVVPGTGLGLALTKKLVEAMGGTLGMRSAPNDGAEFWIDLPAAEPNGEHPAAPPRRLVAVRGGDERTVLYVEDNLATISLMEEVFAMRPAIRLITAMQGSLALELAREHRPDLVILDLHLPDIGGDEVLRELRSDPLTASIPVVMFSADATERQVRRLLDEGARHYLVKPVKIPEFLAVLDEMLSVPAPVAS